MNNRYIMVRWPDGEQRIYKGVKELSVSNGFLILKGDRDAVLRMDDSKVYVRAYKKGWRELRV